MTLLAQNVFTPGRYNNYLVAGNLTNAFAMGDIGAQDDFFLVGAEPPDESIYPLLTGNVLDSEGQPLFKLVRNVLTINPGQCSKIVSDHVGYEIHDSAGNMVFKVETKFQKVAGMEDGEGFITTLRGTLYDKHGAVAFAAHGGDSEHLEANAKMALGFTGNSFAFSQGMGARDTEIARSALLSSGEIHQVLTGDIDGATIQLDGTALIDARLTNCKIRVSTGRWYLRGSTFESCSFEFGGEAAKVRELVEAIVGGAS